MTQRENRTENVRKANQTKKKTKPVRRSANEDVPETFAKTDPEAAREIDRRGHTGSQAAESWDLSRLKRNPHQDDLFFPLDAPDLDRLVDDMRRNGQRTPIEVTKDGRVIDGHQRWRAAEILGREEIQVLVRLDLDGNEFAIERRMIEANLNRRQLDVLGRVRLARRLLEIERKRTPGGLTQYCEQDLRDRLGASLKMSGRNVQRYLNILSAPMEVQRCFSAGKISMKLAEQVARLDAEARGEIEAEIRDGRDPAEVVAAHLPEAAPVGVDPDNEYKLFLAASARAVESLDGSMAMVVGGKDLDQDIAILRQTEVMIRALVARQRTLKKQRAETLRKFGGFGDGH